MATLILIIILISDKNENEGPAWFLSTVFSVFSTVPVTPHCQLSYLLVYEHNYQNIVNTIIQTTTELSCISIIHMLLMFFFIPHDITRSILIGLDVHAEAG